VAFNMPILESERELIMESSSGGQDVIMVVARAQSLLMYQTKFSGFQVVTTCRKGSAVEGIRLMQQFADKEDTKDASVLTAIGALRVARPRGSMHAVDATVPVGSHDSEGCCAFEIFERAVGYAFGIPRADVCSKKVWRRIPFQIFGGPFPARVQSADR
jgi:hypothetical protein